MKANEIPVGQYFVGHVDRDDWFYEDKHCFDGSKINVVVIIPKNDSREESALLMNLYAGLRGENSLQLTDNWSMWVCGMRDKRSKMVKLHDWRSPVSIGASEKISAELTSKIGNPK